MDHQHWVGVRDQLSGSGVGSTTCIIRLLKYLLINEEDIRSSVSVGGALWKAKVKVSLQEGKLTCIDRRTPDVAWLVRLGSSGKTCVKPSTFERTCLVLGSAFEIVWRGNGQVCFHYRPLSSPSMYRSMWHIHRQRYKLWNWLIEWKLCRGWPWRNILLQFFMAVTPANFLCYRSFVLTANPSLHISHFSVIFMPRYILPFDPKSCSNAKLNHLPWQLPLFRKSSSSAIVRKLCRWRERNPPKAKLELEFSGLV